VERGAVPGAKDKKGRKKEKKLLTYKKAGGRLLTGKRFPY
jgi:hypothetical protein